MIADARSTLATEFLNYLDTCPAVGRNCWKRLMAASSPPGGQKRKGFSSMFVFTYGPNGGDRPASFIAGDRAFVTIRVSHLSVGADGKFDFSLQPELVAGDSHSLLLLEPHRINFASSFGGDVVAFSWFYPIPALMVSGKYGLRITVRDKIGEQVATRGRAFRSLTGINVRCLGNSAGARCTRSRPCRWELLGGGQSVPCLSCHW